MSVFHHTLHEPGGQLVYYGEGEAASPAKLAKDDADGVRRLQRRR